MGDETAGPWKGTTGDSSAWETSAVEVHGQWIEVDNALVDATYVELAQYCTFRRLMTNYIWFVWFCRIRGRPLPPAVKKDKDNLEDMIDVFPAEGQVLRRPRRGKGVFSYQTAYLVFSERQPFTRSVMLAQLPAVVVRMKGLNPVFREALIEVTRADFDELYGSVLAAYETWRAMAEANVKVPFTHLRRREEGVRKRAAVRLEELLLALKMLR